MKHTLPYEPGPVETLARLAIQSERYGSDPAFRDAVDAVLSYRVFDAAPTMLEALEDLVPLAAQAMLDADEQEYDIDGELEAAKAAIALTK